MTRKEVIDIVKRRTQERGADSFDWEQAFAERLKLFCLEKHFWWRKQVCSVTTVAGTKTYDLSSATPDFLEPIYVLPSTATDEDDELEPCYDPRWTLLARRSIVRSKPSAYAFDSPQVIRFMGDGFGSPDAAYTFDICYWACPNPSADSTEDSIPLVPSQFHAALVQGLKMDCLEYLFGPDNPRYLAAARRYAEWVDIANGQGDFDNRKMVQLLASDAVSSAT